MPEHISEFPWEFGHAGGGQGGDSQGSDRPALVKLPIKGKQHLLGWLLKSGYKKTPDPDSPISEFLETIKDGKFQLTKLF